MGFHTRAVVLAWTLFAMLSAFDAAAADYDPHEPFLHARHLI